MSNEAIKSYSSPLRPNERKEVLLKRTLKALKNGSEFFFTMIQGWFGGITPEIIHGLLEEDQEDEEIVDLWCAVYWFRPVSVAVATNPIVATDLLMKFEKYYGGTASEYVKQYLSAFIGEGYCWNDCRQQYVQFSANFDGNFDHDLQILCNEKLLAVASIENTPAVISNLFGEGGKEDRQLKVKICQDILDKLHKLQKMPETVAPIQDIILKAANATKDTFRKIYSADGGGKPGTLDIFVTKEGHTEFDKKDLARLIQKLKNDVKNKQKERNWKNNQQLREYIEQNTIAYNSWAWGEMFKAGHTALKTKATRNYNFAKERLHRFQDMKANPNVHVAKELNGFFDSEFFAGEETYVIRPHHLGGRQLPQLFNAWKEHEENDAEPAIFDFCDDLKSNFNREPIKNILKYIFQLHKKYSAEEILSAAKYNEQQEKYTFQKAHPSILGNQGYTWPNAIIRPDKAEQTDRPDSLDLRIWTNLSLLHNDGTWKKHHIPFHNARFFLDVYAEGNAPNTVNFRTPRFGYKLPQLSEATPIRRTSKQHVKVAKIEARIRLAVQQGLLPKIDIPLDKLPAVINENCIVTVPVKFKVAKRKADNPKVGDVICGYDQNQTASHAYSLWEVVKDNTPNSHFYKPIGCYVKFIKSGDIVSITEIKGRQIDQLSYNGLEYKDYANWKKQAKNFASAWQITKKTKEGSMVSIPAVEKFDSIEKYQPLLYRFNKDYAYIMRNIIRYKSQEELQKIRPEIFRFIEQGMGVCRLGSLSIFAIEAVKAAKGIVYSYFSTALNSSKENPISDEQRKQYDPALFQLLENLETIRTHKKEQKLNRIGNALIQICLEYNATFIRGEGDLPTTNKSTKNKQNSRSMDWLARGVFNKILQLAPMHNITLVSRSPYYTSHQDPLVHKNPNDAMKCRYNTITINNIGDKVLEDLSYGLRNRNVGTTGEYYYQGVKEFLTHYNIHDLEEEILKWRRDRKSNIKCWELQNRLAVELGEKDAEIYVPRRGGRIYLATHAVTTDAKLIVFNKKQVWACNADHVASANIALSKNKNSSERTVQ